MSRTFVAAVLVVLLGLLAIMSVVVRESVKEPEVKPPDPAKLSEEQRKKVLEQKKMEEQIMRQSKAAQDAARKAMLKRGGPVVNPYEMDLKENWYRRRKPGEEGLREMKKAVAEIEATKRDQPFKMPAAAPPAATTPSTPREAPRIKP